MKDIKNKFRDFLNESLSKIYISNKELPWNPNKTEKEWKSRIKERTGLSNNTFFELLQLGVNLKEKEFCKSGITCLMFQKSQFIVLIDLPNNKIVTIRDTKWDKIINPEKPCKRIMIFESEEHARDIIENVNFNEVDFEGYSYYMTGDSLILEVQHKCECCLIVDL